MTRDSDVGNMIHKMHLNMVKFEKARDPEWNIMKLESFKRFCETGEDTTMEYIGYLFMVNGMIMRLNAKYKSLPREKIEPIQGWHP